MHASHTDVRHDTHKKACAQGVIRDLVGSASRQLGCSGPAWPSAEPWDEHGLPGPEYEEFMLALEASLLEDLQQEQDQLEAEAVDQAAAEELADLVASCSVSSQPQARPPPQPKAEVLPGTQPPVLCPVCLRGQLRSRGRQRSIACSTPGCLQQLAPMVDDGMSLQGLPRKVAMLKQQHAASGCAGASGFGLMADMDDALFACCECGMIEPLIGGHVH